MTFALGSYQLAYPWLLLIVPLLWLLTRDRSPKPIGIPFPDLAEFRNLKPSLKVRIRGPILNTLLAALVVSATIAASRPQHVTLIESPADRRNLMLAIDVSRSMSATDFSSNFRRMNRLDAVKGVLVDFIAARSEDRIGAVVFGAKAFVQSPLTLDHFVVKELISKLEIGIAGDGTAIGDGLAVALKRMREIQGSSKAVILLTDGASNSGQIEPLTAANIAKELGIKVHTIGIGSNQDVMPSPGALIFGGQGQMAEFDEATLKKMAEVTGGVYFHAKNLEGLKDVYAEIDQLERSSADEPPQRRVEDLYLPWILVALGALLIGHLAATTYFFKVP